jgi:hypothetical protein
MKWLVDSFLLFQVYFRINNLILQRVFKEVWEHLQVIS